MSQFAIRYEDTGVTRNDLFALSLAKHKKCLLLTGDSELIRLAEIEEIEVHGTLLLMGRLYETGKIDAEGARMAYENDA